MNQISKKLKNIFNGLNSLARTISSQTQPKQRAITLSFPPEVAQKFKERMAEAGIEKETELIRHALAWWETCADQVPKGPIIFCDNDSKNYHMPEIPPFNNIKEYHNRVVDFRDFTPK